MSLYDLDLTGCGISAGAVNAHTHLYSALAPDTRPAGPFLDILQKLWWRLDRALDAESLRASARLYIAEALLAGTTTLIDHHESPFFIDGSLDVLADAAQELGIHLAVAYGATERNGGPDEGRRGLAESRRFLHANQRPLVRGLAGLHASFTVSDETIREAGAMGVPVHVHVAEDEHDVSDARKRGYPGPLERMLTLGGLPYGSVLAHGVWLDRRQVQHAVGMWLVQNPRSNEGNGVGYPGALKSGICVALGTDGYPADMREEERALVRLARANHDDERTLPARVRGGGLLAASLFGNLEDDLVARETSGRVRHVTVAGKVVVEDGKLVTADVEEIRAHAREQAARLWRRMEELP